MSQEKGHIFHNPHKMAQHLLFLAFHISLWCCVMKFKVRSVHVDYAEGANRCTSYYSIVVCMGKH